MASLPTIIGVFGKSLTASSANSPTSAATSPAVWAVLQAVDIALIAATSFGLSALGPHPAATIKIAARIQIPFLLI